ncbi:hypothetical protein ACP70R_007399 [Stipagrostis hirtigluma subsp. patula]
MSFARQIHSGDDHRSMEVSARTRVPPPGDAIPPSVEEPGVEQVEEAMRSLSRRISLLLTSGVSEDDPLRPPLKFMVMELSAVAASLRTLALTQDRPPDVKDGGWRWERARQHERQWLKRLMLYAQEIGRFFPERSWPTFPFALFPIALLGWAAAKAIGVNVDDPLLRYRSREEDILKMALNFFCCTQDRRRYSKHLLLSSSGHGLPSPHGGEESDDGLYLVGIHGPIMKLLRWLARTAAHKSLRVISIVGPLGVGKTTLAMELHRRLHCRIGDGTYDFQLRAKARVTRGRNRSTLLLRRILREIADPGASATLSSDHRQSTTSEQLVGAIRKRLQDRRYFILIDDLSEASDWEEIKDAFPNNNNGSRILITTRIRSVAWSCCSDYGGLVHEMKPLNELDSEKLLLTKAFGSVHSLPPGQPFKKVCYEILRRCEGIPLCITAMANWLRQQQHQQDVAEVPRLLTEIEQALYRHYDDLPYMLRLFLMYMSMFPKGYMFDKDRLVMKWLDEGLTPTYTMLWDEEMYKGAERYFSQLVDRNVISPVRRCPDDAESSYWKINQFMLQFLTSKSAEMGFAFTGGTLNLAARRRGVKETGIMPRRLALHQPDSNLPGAVDLSATRSLAFSGAGDRIRLSEFSYLVVLDLEGWENLENYHLEQICITMRFLGFLSIKKTRVSELPSNISDLYFLRTLDVSHTQITEFPWQVIKLKFLRTVDASHTQITELPSIFWCLKYLCKLDLRNTQIRTLPGMEIFKPHSLRELLIGGDRMIDSDETAATVPQQICDVKSMEKLATVDLRECSERFVKDLGMLDCLRTIAITWSFDQCSRRAYRDALLSSIQKWTQLESLTIHCGLLCSMEFLGLLSYPPMKLEKFKVTTGKFVRIPQWIRGLNFLAFLQITVCTLVPDDLKILGGLPKLQCLLLGLDFIPREEIVVEVEGFNMLEIFSLDCPVPWLTFKEGAMQMLAYLVLKICSGPANREGAVPLGISNLGSLAEVAINYNQMWCANSSSVRRTVEAVKKQVAEHCNSIDIVINGTRVDDVQKHDEAEWETIIQRVVDGEVKSDAHAADGKTVRTAPEIQGEIEAEGGTKSDA